LGYDVVVLKTPFFVAEISANHLNSLDRAHMLVEEAARAGADAIKLQTYKPETMTLNLPGHSVSKDHKLWGGQSLYNLYSEAMTPWEWHAELFEHALQLKMIPFSSPFDRTAVDFLEELNCPIYKVASLETGDVDLINYISLKGKPTIVSTGASTLNEIQEALDATGHNKKNSILLVCTSSYPAAARDAHLNRIRTLKEKFDVAVGVSDHTLGIGVSVAAIALGAAVIEKHLTIKRSDGGHDASFSLEPNEFKLLVEEGNKAYESLGNSSWVTLESENESRRLRRSLFITEDVKAGELATRENVKALRPNSGAPVSNLHKMLGRRFLHDYEKGSPAHLECVEFGSP
jgi:pseudaminic acid synthase